MRRLEKETHMSSLRKFRYPIFIGAGVIAAGALFYFVRAGVNFQHTQGAIGQREVYRDGQVNASDVQANPGSAPVATKALLETKEFKALEKNQAFQELMANASFQMLARNAQFLEVMHSEAFLQMAQNGLFQHYMSHPAMAELAQWMARNSAQLQTAALTERLNASLSAANAQELEKNQMFQRLFRNEAFQGLMARSESAQALSNGLMLRSFAGLAQNGSFQSLIARSSFQNALLQGSAANLSSEMMARMQVR
jgi:hypothetical protein